MMDGCNCNGNCNCNCEGPCNCGCDNIYNGFINRDTMFRDIINVCDQPEFYNKPGYVEDPEEEEPTEPVNPEGPENPEEPEITGQPNDEIWYTTTTHKNFKDQANFTPSFEDFNANLVSDTYDETNDKGIMKFDQDVTVWDTGAWEWDNVYYIDTISLPASLTQIGSYGYFHRCPITSITLLSETPLELTGGSALDKFDAMYDDFVIYVPADSVDAYKEAWSDVADRIKPIE